MVNSPLQELHFKSLIFKRGKLTMVWWVWKPDGSEERIEGNEVKNASAEK